MRRWESSQLLREDCGFSSSPGHCQAFCEGKLEGEGQGACCSVPFPRLSSLMCHASVRSSHWWQETCSDDGSKWSRDRLERPMGRLWDLQWLWQNHGTEAVVTLERVLGEPEIRATRGGKALWGGTREAKLLCRCWGWPRLGAAGPGQGKVHRWSPFCQEMPDAAAGRGCWAQLCTFPGPQDPLGSLWEEGMVSQPTPDPTRDSFLPDPGVIPVCVHMCERERAEWCWQSFVWVAFKEQLRKKGSIVQRSILLVAIDGKSACPDF